MYKVTTDELSSWECALEKLLQVTVWSDPTKEGKKKYSRAIDRAMKAKKEINKILNPEPYGPI